MRMAEANQVDSICLLGAGNLAVKPPQCLEARDAGHCVMYYGHWNDSTMRGKPCLTGRLKAMWQLVYSLAGCISH
jgi:hypothetical protein